MKALLIDVEEGTPSGRKGSCEDKKVGRHKLPLGDSPAGLNVWEVTM